MSDDMEISGLPHRECAECGDVRPTEQFEGDAVCLRCQRSAGRCPAHLEPEPCATCAAHIAAGL